MKAALKIMLPVCVFIIVFPSSTFRTQDTKWVAPTSADTLNNPLKNNPTAETEGKKLYDKYCWACHGKTGKGDGPGAKNLNPKPADHTSNVVQSQSDGAIFWKISKGRGAMQPYERSLNKTQRWQLVIFMRSLASPEK